MQLGRCLLDQLREGSIFLRPFGKTPQRRRRAHIFDLHPPAQIPNAHPADRSAQVHHQVSAPSLHTDPETPPTSGPAIPPPRRWSLPAPAACSVSASLNHPSPDSRPDPPQTVPQCHSQHREPIAEAIRKRESSMSTGIGFGIGIPQQSSGGPPGSKSWPRPWRSGSAQSRGRSENRARACARWS
jgi:hypothetical protein